MIDVDVLEELEGVIASGRPRGVKVTWFSATPFSRF
jgi:hypothetical protein